MNTQGTVSKNKITFLSTKAGKTKLITTLILGVLFKKTA